MQLWTSGQPLVAMSDYLRNALVDPLEYWTTRLKEKLVKREEQDKWVLGQITGTETGTALPLQVDHERRQPLCELATTTSNPINPLPPMPLLTVLC